MRKNIEVLSGQGSKDAAHNVDFTKEDHLIRQESALEKAVNLNRLETLIKNGGIVLHKLPTETTGVIVGQEVYIDRKYQGYLAYKSLDDELFVNLNSVRKFVRPYWKLLYSGPIQKIEYRDPDDNKKKYGTSDKVFFAVFDDGNRLIAVQDQR